MHLKLSLLIAIPTICVTSSWAATRETASSSDPGANIGFHSQIPSQLPPLKAHSDPGVAVSAPQVPAQPTQAEIENFMKRDAAASPVAGALGRTVALGHTPSGSSSGSGSFPGPAAESAPRLATVHVGGFLPHWPVPQGSNVSNQGPQWGSPKNIEVLVMPQPLPAPLQPVVQEQDLKANAGASPAASGSGQNAAGEPVLPGPDILDTPYRSLSDEGVLSDPGAEKAAEKAAEKSTENAEED